jgi:DNA-directed RNA polymerase subunit RPC12/RpoP
LAKEYDSGVRTGDYVCTQCGAKLTFRQRAELLESRGS